MNLQEKLEAEIKSAMKEKQELKRDTLRVLKGELERKGKTSLDLEVSNAAKKMIEGIILLNNDNGEISILNEFVLHQLSEEEIRKNVIEQIHSLNNKNMGAIMSYFKNEYGGRYDGKLLSTIVKEELA